MVSLVGHFSLKKEDDLHPVHYKSIMQYQQNYKSPIETAKLNKDCSIKHLHRADKNHSLVFFRKHKIVIPKLLEK